jgi:hypothetical protein
MRSPLCNTDLRPSTAYTQQGGIQLDMTGQDLDVLWPAVVAGLLGYLVGAEREYIAHREARTSTFGLVKMSSDHARWVVHPNPWGSPLATVPNQGPITRD